MNKTIAIHHYSGDFSERWIEYCINNKITYKIVDCYANDILEVMKDYDILLWSWNLSKFESLRFARELTYSLELMGKKVFPNFKTSFFYDNKVGQKYLLESIGAPIIPSYVFYDKKEAKEWAQTVSFPKVFKLSGGAGSLNVKLCHNQKQAISLIEQAFNNGFSQVDRWSWFTDKVGKFKEKPSKKSGVNLVKSIGRLFVPTQKEKSIGREKGYVYFQDFVPENTFDIRVIVIGDKAFGLKRLCRENDFRASGSGKIVYSKSEFNINCIQISFEISRLLDVECMAYDFIFDKNDNPLIVEMSYHFAPYSYDNCEGFWDNDLNWVETQINPQFMIMDMLLEE